ncbi:MULTISPECIES: RNA polymerase sigma factor [unclassified Micromonospora]|uniref:RNA polymerase sigma factor n=1 Tax=unclassified Micromonospora TaxID=2617518 RepID=UPI0022B6F121|nr:MULTISPECIES: RNA polymerase sigma factor [unclassified Micromonospora]MCZ7421604.1 RNA polymerase sigma factor [Verrucosispora sp. WMMA2121]WBB93715.1 RNA polymerase sigma factor [Verrucosispora sp. WMMC514]
MDADEFETFVRESAPTLRRYARAVTADPGRAEELLEQTYVRVATSWQRLLADGSPLGYAKVAMVRLHVSRLRTIARRVRSLPTARRPVSAEAGGPDDGHLRRLLAGLAPLQRVVLVMTYLDDLDDESIAAAIGRRPGTVRSLRHRALDTVRDGLPITRVRPEVEAAG